MEGGIFCPFYVLDNSALDCSADCYDERSLGGIVGVCPCEEDSLGTHVSCRHFLY